MRIFVYKSLIIVFLIFVLFHATFGYLLRSYEENFTTHFPKINRSYENKIREEINEGLKRPNNGKRRAVMIKNLTKFQMKLIVN